MTNSDPLTHLCPYSSETTISTLITVSSIIYIFTQMTCLYHRDLPSQLCLFTSCYGRWGFRFLDIYSPRLPFSHFPSILKQSFFGPGTKAHAYNTSYSGGWGSRIAWSREAEVVVSWDSTIALQLGQQDQNSVSKKRINFKKLKSVQRKAMLQENWLVGGEREGLRASAGCFHWVGT